MSRRQVVTALSCCFAPLLVALRFICFNWSDTWATSKCHMSTLPPIFADAAGLATGTQWASADQEAHQSKSVIFIKFDGVCWSPAVEAADALKSKCLLGRAKLEEGVKIQGASGKGLLLRAAV